MFAVHDVRAGSPSIVEGIQHSLVDHMLKAKVSVSIASRCAQRMGSWLKLKNRTQGGNVFRRGRTSGTATYTASGGRVDQVYRRCIALTRCQQMRTSIFGFFLNLLMTMRNERMKKNGSGEGLEMIFDMQRRRKGRQGTFRLLKCEFACLRTVHSERKNASETIESLYRGAMQRSYCSHSTWRCV